MFSSIRLIGDKAIRKVIYLFTEELWLLFVKRRGVSLFSRWTVQVQEHREDGFFKKNTRKYNPV